MSLGLLDIMNIAMSAVALAMVLLGLRTRRTATASERVRGFLTPAEAAPVLIWMGVALLLWAVGGSWSRHTSGDAASVAGIAVLLGGFVAFGVALVLIVRARSGRQRHGDGAARR